MELDEDEEDIEDLAALEALKVLIDDEATHESVPEGEEEWDVSCISDGLSWQSS